MTEAEELELLELESQAAAAAQKDPSMLKTGLGVAGKALDYVGGVTRAGVANVADAFVPGDIATAGDLGNAIMANPPTTAEYLERANVPEGAKVDFLAENRKIPFTDINIGAGNTSVRDAVGFVGDVALDPLTYASLGSSAVLKQFPKLANLMKAADKTNVLSKGTEMVGKKAFQSGLKNVDKKLIDKGVKPVSDVLWEKGGWGSNKSIKGTTEELMKASDIERRGLYSKVDSAGATIDPRYALQDSLDKAKKLQDLPTTRDMGKKLEEKILNYMNEGPVSIQKASDWKTSLYDDLPESAFDKNGRLKKPAQEINKSMANGFKREIESAGEFVEPGLGQKISQVNEDWGSLIAAQKPLKTEISKGVTKDIFTSIDPLFLLAGGGVGGLPGAVAGYGLKKGADFSKTTLARTTTGKALKGLSKTRLPDAAVRHSPWLRMNEEQ